MTPGPQDDFDDDFNGEYAFWEQLQRLSELNGLPNKKPARALIKQLLSQYPGHPDVLVQLSYALRAEGDHAGAIVAARAALGQEPTDLDALTQLAWAQYLSDDSKGAFRTIDALAEIDPDDEDAWELRGYLHLEKREFALAEDAAHGFLGLDPENARAHNLMGEVFAGAGDAALARAAFEAALQLEPESPQAHNGLAHVALLENDPVKALESARTAGRIDPSAYRESIEAAATLGASRLMIDAIWPNHGERRPKAGLVLLFAFTVWTGAPLYFILAGPAWTVRLLAIWLVALPGTFLATGIARDHLQPGVYRARAYAGLFGLFITLIVMSGAEVVSMIDVLGGCLLGGGLFMRMVGALDSRESRVLDELEFGTAVESRDRGAQVVEDGFAAFRSERYDDARTTFGQVLENPRGDTYTQELAKSGIEALDSPLGMLAFPELESEGAFARGPRELARARNVASSISIVGFSLGCVALRKEGGGAQAALIPLLVTFAGAQLACRRLPWVWRGARVYGPLAAVLALGAAVVLVVIEDVQNAFGTPMALHTLAWMALVPMIVVGLGALSQDDDEESPDAD